MGESQGYSKSKRTKHVVYFTSCRRSEGTWTSKLQETYIGAFYEIIDFFRAQKDKTWANLLEPQIVAPNAKRCRAQSGEAYQLDIIS